MTKMKRLPVLITLAIGLLTSTCERTHNNPEYPFEAEVLGPNMDCGLYQIRFSNDLDGVVEKVGNSVINGLYIAENLPGDLKHEGMSIILDVREPQPSELGICTAMGPSLTWLHVIKAKLK
jgi:hypothetical protein